MPENRPGVEFADTDWGYRKAVTQVNGVRVLGSGQRNLALVLPDHDSELAPDGVQEEIGYRLARDPDTTVALLPVASDIAERAGHIERLHRTNTAAIGLVSPSQNSIELYRTLAALPEAPAVDGVVAPEGVDLSGYLLPYPHLDFLRFTPGEGPIAVGERWDRAREQRLACRTSLADLKHFENSPTETAATFLRAKAAISQQRFRERGKHAEVMKLLHAYRFGRLYTDALNQIPTFDQEAFELLLQTVDRHVAGQRIAVPERALSADREYRLPVVASNITAIRNGAQLQLALLAGYGCVANARELVVYPPPSPPTEKQTSALLHPSTAIRAARAERRRLAERARQPSIFNRAAALRKAHTELDTTVVVAAGDAEQTAILLAGSGTRSPAGEPKSFTILGDGPESRELAEHLIAHGVASDQVSSPPERTGISAILRSARARREPPNVASAAAAGGERLKRFRR